MIEPPVVLVLTEEPWGLRRFLARFGVEEAGLAPAARDLLLDLHQARQEGAGWIELPQTTANRKRVCRLREQLRQLHPEARFWVENDGQGRYRLTAAAPPIEVKEP